jgi:hypothetical protein
MITAFDEAVADALATFNASMAAKFEAILDTAELRAINDQTANLPNKYVEHVGYKSAKYNRLHHEQSGYTPANPASAAQSLRVQHGAASSSITSNAL